MARVTSSVNAQMNKIDKMIENILSTAVQETARELVERVSTPILNGFGQSPVWTGQFIDNWRVGVNSVDTSTNPQNQYYQLSSGRLGEIYPVTPRPSSAIGKNVSKLSQVKIGDTITISNSTSYYDTSSGEIYFTAADVNRGTRTAPKGVTQPALEASLERINMRIKRAIGLQAKRGLL